ncbi:MAG: DNRLRE domain-containing protein [Verrucomicrobiota bacterium]
MNASPFSLRSLGLAMLAALSVGPLSAATLLLNPTSDNFIRSDNTGSNSNSNVLLVGGLVSAGGDLRSLLSFDLSSPDLVGATINSVTLTLRTNDIDTNSAGGVLQVNLNLLDSNFTETGATWANSGTGAWTAGGPFSTLLSTTSGEVKSEVGTSFSFASSANFTSTVTSTVSGTGILNLLLKLDTEGGSDRNIFRFTSSEPNLSGGVTADFAPLLTIDYTAPIPEPAGFALLGGLAALTAVGCRRRR